MIKPTVQLSPRDMWQIDHESDKRCYVPLPISPAIKRRVGVRQALRREDLAPTVIARFHQKIHKTDSCWLWTGTATRQGYGQVYAYREDSGYEVRIGAHRISYVLVHGYVPADLEVMHKCDTTNCVNPDHLTLGTHHDNMLDRTAKGRDARTKPTLRKISPEGVIEIRQSTETASVLAARFGVCNSHIHKIRRGEKRKVA